MAELRSIVPCNADDFKSIRDCDDFMVFALVQFDENGCPLLCANVLFESRELAEWYLDEVREKYNVKHYPSILPCRFYYEPIVNYDESEC